MIEWEEVKGNGGEGEDDGDGGVGSLNVRNA